MLLVAASESCVPDSSEALFYFTFLLQWASKLHNMNLELLGGFCDFDCEFVR